jgi:hypothetical protein
VETDIYSLNTGSLLYDYREILNSSRCNKAKAVPLHATEALAAVREYSSYSFSTSVLNEDEWSASGPGRALAPGKDPRYPLCRRLGGPQSRSGLRGYRKNSFASAGDRTSIA